MNVPITSTHAPSQAVDDDLIEALGYFSEDMSGPTQVSSSPLDLGASSPTKFSEEEPTDEAVHAILLSLEVQDLFSDEKDKVVDVPVSVKSSESSSSSAQQQEKQTSPKKIDRRLRPYSTCKRRNRRRPKHELEYLRAKVLELQEELEALNKTEIGSPSAVSQETALVETGVSSWKEIAQRQKLEACNSFAENRRLRNRLLGQLQVARVLEAAIDKHQKETGGSIGWPVAMTSTDHEIFAQLNASVEKQFAEVNTAFTTSGLSKVLHELSGGLEFKREANGVCIRHEETRLLPFEMQTLHQALWNCLHSGAVVKQTHAQMVTQDHSNLIIRETIELAKSRINVLKRAVFRRYFEKNRVIFVWSSSVEIDGSVSVRLREKGWSSCSTFDFYRGVNAGASKSNNCVQGCMARMAVQLTPEMTKFQSDFEAQRHIGEMTDLIVGTYSQNFGLIHDVVEKVLVKPSKPRPTPSFAVC